MLVIITNKVWILLAISLLCTYYGLDIVGFWLALISVIVATTQRTIRRFYESIIEDYPKEYCVTPKLFKKIFATYQTYPEKGVPREIYYGQVTIYILFGIYTMVTLGMIFFGRWTAYILGEVYFIFLGTVTIWEFSAGSWRCFVARYKVLNRFNFKYLLSSTKEPIPEKIGDCKIIEKYKNRNKILVTVKMLNSNESVQNVVFSRCEKEGEDITYQLYELCKVKYII